ncbi:hypothetical protein AKJ16_DCAP06400 [Drosera capensis]
MGGQEKLDLRQEDRSRRIVVAPNSVCTAIVAHQDLQSHNPNPAALIRRIWRATLEAAAAPSLSRRLWSPPRGRRRHRHNQQRHLSSPKRHHRCHWSSPRDPSSLEVSQRSAASSKFEPRLHSQGRHHPVLLASSLLTVTSAEPSIVALPRVITRWSSETRCKSTRGPLISTFGSLLWAIVHCWITALGHRFVLLGPYSGWIEVVALFLFLDQKKDGNETGQDGESQQG